MFELVKSYRITTIVGNELTHVDYVVEDINLPLIQVRLEDISIIMNTSSQSFVSAMLVDSETARASQDAWLDSLSNDDKPN